MSMALRVLVIGLIVLLASLSIWLWRRPWSPVAEDKSSRKR